MWTKKIPNTPGFFMVRTISGRLMEYTVIEGADEMDEDGGGRVFYEMGSDIPLTLEDLKEWVAEDGAEFKHLPMA